MGVEREYRAVSLAVGCVHSSRAVQMDQAHRTLRFSSYATKSECGVEVMPVSLSNTTLAAWQSLAEFATDDYWTSKMGSATVGSSLHELSPCMGMEPGVWVGNCHSGLGLQQDYCGRPTHKIPVSMERGVVEHTVQSLRTCCFASYSTQG